jgi:hypothetical protein
MALLKLVALRLYPSVPVNTRTTIRTTVLPTGGGPDRDSPVLVPKGSAVAFSVYSMHRRPDLYGMDAELFRPNDGTKTCLYSRTQQPLSGAIYLFMVVHEFVSEVSTGHFPVAIDWIFLTRILLVDFALTEAAYTVVRLLQRFQTIKLPAEEKVELVGIEKQDMTLVISIKEGCKVEIN